MIRKYAAFVLWFFSSVSLWAESPRTIEPIRLEQNNTLIRFSDILPLGEIVDSVSLPPHFKPILSKDKSQLRVLNVGGKIPYISVLTIFVKGKSHDVVLFKSSKIIKVMEVPDAQKKFKSVSIAGDFNHWDPKATPLTLINGKWVTNLPFEPGTYEYQFVMDGAWKLDAANHDSVKNSAGKYNSVLKVGRNFNVLPHLSTLKCDDSSFTCIIDKNRIEKWFVFINNQCIDSSYSKQIGNTLYVKIPRFAKSMNHADVRIYAYNSYGRANDILVPLENGKVLTSINGVGNHNLSVYSLQVDRFLNKNTANDIKNSEKELASSVNFQGGDLAGVISKLKDGYFEQMGVNCICLSPLLLNTDKAFAEYAPPHHKLSAFHGEWPTSFSKIDPRFGTSNELLELIHVAHTKNIKVLIEVVTNHVHADHPILKKYPDWITPMVLPNGTKNVQDWDLHPTTTWKEVFLPDLDFRKKEVCEAVSDSLIAFARKYDVDGYMHKDANLIPELFWSTLSHRIESQLEMPIGKKLIQLTSFAASREESQQFIQNGNLESNLDYQLSKESHIAFIDTTFSLAQVANTLELSMQCFGSHHHMGNTTGSQSEARYVSYATGALSFKEDERIVAWQKHPSNPKSIAYKRLLQLVAFNACIPGFPMMYYGDEIGMSGAGFPDNVRSMKWDSLTTEENKLLEKIQMLNQLRSKNMALVLGDTRIISAGKNQLILLRNYFGSYAIAFFNTSAQTIETSLPLPNEMMDVALKSSFGAPIKRDKNRMLIRLEGNSFELVTN